MFSFDLKKIVMLISIATVSVAGFWYYKENMSNKTGIFDYKPSRDRAFLINLFNENRYWLVGESIKDFSAEYTLDNKASSRNPMDKNNLIIKVQVEDGKPAGLVAYRILKLLEAQILYLVVDQKYRGKGYAKNLLEYALGDLKKRDMNMAWLITRMGNKPARSLYESLAFKEFWSDDKFIKYKKYLI